jgi:hypothetical protein
MPILGNNTPPAADKNSRSDGHFSIGGTSRQWNPACGGTLRPQRLCGELAFWILFYKNQIDTLFHSAFFFGAKVRSFVQFGNVLS